MNITRNHTDVRRACRRRRARRAAMPAHVLLPVSLAVGLVVVSAAIAAWLGLGPGGLAAATVLAAVVAAAGAHRTVGSLAAGAGILLAQPYGAGERVHVYVPSFGRTVDAEVVRIGAANTTLLVRDEHGADSLIVVPNNRMLRPGSARSEKSKQA
jgi:small-conductance mechanosensitive channel